MKKIAFIATGGTISTVIDPKTGTAVPALSGEQLLELVPEICKLCKVDIIQFGMVGSSQLQPGLFLEMAGLIRRLQQQEGYDGFVITQGTDALEETSFLLDLLLDIPAPVVMTGAMRHSQEAGYDGPANMMQAFAVALSDKARDKGVMVVFAGEIFAALDVQKGHSFHPAPFHAPGRGPIGSVLGNRVVFFYQPLLRQHVAATRLDAKVAIVKAGIGDERPPVDNSGYGGFVIEGTGVGNGQVWMESWVREVVAMGKPVVITSRSPAGWVEVIYGYPGSGGKLVEAGAILAPGISAVKARLKLIAALGSGLDGAGIRRLFEWD